MTNMAVAARPPGVWRRLLAGLLHVAPLDSTGIGSALRRSIVISKERPDQLSRNPRNLRQRAEPV